jgi:hypothetical protein
MECSIVSIYKEGDGVTVRFATKHVDLHIEPSDDVNVGFQNIQLFKSLFTPQHENEYDDIGIIHIQQAEWDNLEQKYSVGDMFRIKFSPQGINIEKL